MDEKIYLIGNCFEKRNKKYLWENILAGKFGGKNFRLRN